jgi:hypothetical protein
MKTDTSVKTEMRQTRRTLFWRLYVLPWALLVLGLTAFSYFMLIEYKSLQKDRVTLLSDDKEEYIDLGMKIIQREAVSKGYGEWNVDERLKVDFTWTDSIESRAFSPDIPIEDTNRIPFTYVDLEWSDSLGMDLEQDIISSARVTIQNTFKHPKAKDLDMFGLENILKEEVEKAIRKRFDGFETYKRTR